MFFSVTLHFPGDVVSKTAHSSLILFVPGDAFSKTEPAPWFSCAESTDQCKLKYLDICMLHTDGNSGFQTRMPMVYSNDCIVSLYSLHSFCYTPPTLNPKPYTLLPPTSAIILYSEP